MLDQNIRKAILEKIGIDPEFATENETKIGGTVLTSKLEAYLRAELKRDTVLTRSSVIRHFGIGISDKNNYQPNDEYESYYAAILGCISLDDFRRLEGVSCCEEVNGVYRFSSDFKAGAVVEIEYRGTNMLNTRKITLEHLSSGLFEVIKAENTTSIHVGDRLSSDKLMNAGRIQEFNLVGTKLVYKTARTSIINIIEPEE